MLLGSQYAGTSSASGHCYLCLFKNGDTNHASVKANGQLIDPFFAVNVSILAFKTIQTRGYPSLPFVAANSIS